MSTILYVALATGDQTSGYQATFPDIAGGAAAGRDLAELLANARKVLTDHLDSLANAGETWPQPTPLERIEPSPGARAILVDIAVDDPPVRVNISLGERLLQRLDAASEARGMTRSGFIAQAVREKLGERERGGADFDAAARRLQDELSALGRRINESLGPDSAFSRRVADLDDRVYDGVRKAADSVSAAMTRRRDANRAAAPREGSSAPPAD
jgi:predicted RNase H-like HicB family nuclease